MPVKGFHACQQLLVVPEGDEDLRMVPHGLLQHRERSLADLVFFKRAKLALIQLGFWDMNVLTAAQMMVSQASMG